MMKRNTFTLIHDATGQSIKALVIARSTGGRFMKIWQGTGWEKRLSNLQGNSLRVLWHLVSGASWGNLVPGPSETATSMNLRQPHVSRAYTELTKADFLYKFDGTYCLSPYFCWKGNDQQYEQAIKKLNLFIEGKAPCLRRLYESNK